MIYTREILPIFGAVLLMVSCAKAQESEPVSKKERAAIVLMVKDSQRACFMSNNVDKYMAVWTDDARLIGGRSATPDASDVVLNRTQIDATKRLRFGDKRTAPKLSVTFKDVELKISGKTGELRWRATMGGAGFQEVVDERYILRRTDKGWRVSENRYWIVSASAGPGGSQVLMDASYWEKKDAAVKAAESAQEPMALAKSLVAAHRFGDAYKLLLTVPKEKQVESYWSMRAMYAVVVGEVADGKQSACRAKRLNPNGSIPAWGKHLKCGKQ